jgi:hypothetical protein
MDLFVTKYIIYLKFWEVFIFDQERGLLKRSQKIQVQFLESQLIEGQVLLTDCWPHVHLSADLVEQFG